ncbi:MAG: hypothetical protein ACRCYO_10875 [Bacteroidia bacterium]
MIRKITVFFILFLALSFVAQAQYLSFFGIEGVRFGMKAAELKNKTVILDSTSSYNDTATYIRLTRCLVYYRKAENLQLNGFVAARVEYEFCEGELVYVFIRVVGQQNIEQAFIALRKRFPQLKCPKKVAADSCLLYDTSHKNLRIIARKFPEKQEMTFVLIPKQAAK